MKNTTLNGTGFAKPRRRPLHDKMCLLLIGLLVILPAVSVAEDQKDDKGGGETSSVFVHAVEATGDCLVHTVEAVSGLLVHVVKAVGDSLEALQKGCESAQESVAGMLRQDTSQPPKADNAEPPAPVSANEVAKAPTAASEQPVAASLAEKPQSSTSSTAVEPSSAVAAEPEMDDEPIEIMSDPAREAKLRERRKDPARAAAAAKFLLDL